MPRRRKKGTIRLDSQTATKYFEDGTGEWCFAESHPSEKRGRVQNRSAGQMPRGKKLKTWTGYMRGMPKLRIPSRDPQMPEDENCDTDDDVDMAADGDEDADVDSDVDEVSREDPWLQTRLRQADGFLNFCSIAEVDSLHRVTVVEERLKYLEYVAILSRFAPHVLTSRSRGRSLDAKSFFEVSKTTDFSSTYVVLSSHVITYVSSLGTAHDIQVAKHVELFNEETFELGAADLGAFPFHPEFTRDGRQTWVDTKLLDHYVDLHHRAPFVSHTHLESVFRKLTGVNIDRRDWGNIIRQYRATVRPSETDDLHHLGIEMSHEQKSDPFRDCPACAITPENEETDTKYAHMPLGDMKKRMLTQLEEVQMSPRRLLLSVSMDAVAKAVRFHRFKDGRPLPVVKNKPLLCDYVHTPGELTKPAGSVAPAVSVAHTVNCDGDTECEQRIRASRDPDKNISGSWKLAEHCVCAAVCAHGIVPRNGVISSDRPEHFGLYFDLTHRLCDARSFCYVCIDNGCQVGPSFQKRFPDLLQKHPTMRFTTGSWHGAAHKLSCRVHNSMTFQSGAGRRHGENTEQLWAALKPAWRYLKYMNHDNHKFGLEECIWGWNCTKRAGILRQMYSWMSKLPKKHQEQCKEKDNILQKLRDEGLDDVKILNLSNTLRANALGVRIGDPGGQDETANEFHKGVLEYVKYKEKAKYFRTTNPQREMMTPYGKPKKDAETLASESEGKAQAALKACGILEKVITEDLYERVHLTHIQRECTSARMIVEKLFSARHALYTDDKHGVLHHLSLEKKIKHSLTVNERQIHEGLFVVEYWEEAHNMIVKQAPVYERYSPEVIYGWLGKHTGETFFFPKWRQLMDKDNKPIALRDDGCESATIRHLVICFTVLMEDIRRTEEEARFLPLELQRIKLFYMHRKRVLSQALDDVEEQLQVHGANFPEELAECDLSEIFGERTQTLKRWLCTNTDEVGFMDNFYLRARAHGLRRLLNNTEDILADDMLNSPGEGLVKWLEAHVS